MPKRNTTSDLFSSKINHENFWFIFKQNQPWKNLSHEPHKALCPVKLVDVSTSCRGTQLQQTQNAQSLQKYANKMQSVAAMCPIYLNLSHNYRLEK